MTKRLLENAVVGVSRGVPATLESHNRFTAAPRRLCLRSNLVTAGFFKQQAIGERFVEHGCSRIRKTICRNVGIHYQTRAHRQAQPVISDLQNLPLRHRHIRLQVGASYPATGSIMML